MAKLKNSHRACRPMAVLGDRTGLPLQLLRARERRYGAVRPSRGAAGRRFDTGAAVGRLARARRATLPGA